MIKEIKTWRNLFSALASLSPEQLSQPIQCCGPISDDSKVHALLSGIAIGTVDGFEFAACRSTHNNKYCPADVVLLMDHNPFAEDGAVAYEWDFESDTAFDDLIGKENPIYGKDGPTQKCDQIRPNEFSKDQPWRDPTGTLPSYLIATVNRRAMRIQGDSEQPSGFDSE